MGNLRNSGSDWPVREKIMYLVFDILTDNLFALNQVSMLSKATNIFFLSDILTDNLFALNQVSILSKATNIFFLSGTAQCAGCIVSE